MNSHKVSQFGSLLILSFLMLIFQANLHGIELKKIIIVSRVNNEKITTEKSKFAHQGDKVELFCVLEAVIENNVVYFSEAEQIELDNRKIPASKMRKWDVNSLKNIEIEWFKVEPYMMHEKLKGNDPECLWFKWYTNAHVPGCNKNRGWIDYDQIEYKEIKIVNEKNKWIIGADAHPTDILYDINNGLGVMRYKVMVTHYSGDHKQIICSLGKESVNNYGIIPKVHMVNFRKDDSFLGWLSSFFNVPGVFGSTKVQVEEYIGIDCADLITGAYNKFKKKDVSYSNVEGLMKHTKIIIDSKYLHSNGKISASGDSFADVDIEFGKDVLPGDIIFFNYPENENKKSYGSWDHVGVIYADKGNDGKADGKLNKYDLILHAGPEEPRLNILNYQGFTGDIPTLIRIGRFK